MLEYLRKNASSWLAKGIFGLIALIFALYFGFTKSSSKYGGSGVTTPIARVNGQSIPSGLFSQMVGRQMEIYQKLGNAGKGQELEQLLQSQVLQHLISSTLMAQEGHRLGLHISDAELAEAIRSDAAFQKNGSFDEDFYLNQFKPFYERQNGVNFETGLREDLLQERFRQVLEQANVISQASLQDELKLQGTELKFIEVTVPFGTEGEGHTREEAMGIAREWIQARQAKKTGEDILKKYKIEAVEMGPKPLAALSAFFGGMDGLPILSCLVISQPGQACPEPHVVENNIVAVELMERTQKPQDLEAAKAMENQLKMAKQNLILAGVSNYLTRHAKIETFLTK
jgi:parvulin-like peptidyl-prolyl isomerase